MNGIYVALVAIYILILAVHIVNRQEYANFIRGLLIIISMVTLIISVLLQILL